MPRFFNHLALDLHSVVVVQRSGMGAMTTVNDHDEARKAELVQYAQS